MLNLNPWLPVKNLFLSSDSATIFKVLTQSDYKSKNRWLFRYYQHLPIEDIRDEHLNALKELFSSAEINHFLNLQECLLKYESIENGFIVEIVQIILNRVKAEPFFARSLGFIFYKETEINKQLLSLFWHSRHLLLKTPGTSIHDLNFK